MRSFTLAFAIAVLSGCPTAAPPCGPSNCTGCCDSSGTCQAGLTTQTCGSAGTSCAQCSVSDTCSFGKCTPTGPFNQGGGMVVTAGGSAGGGAAGGASAGGSATAGGSAGDGGLGGGAAAGGSAGGSVVDAGQPNPCAGTLTFCSTRCLDLAADPENCGACGRLCGQGQVCNRGQCAVLPDDCTTSGVACGAGYFCDPVTKHCLTGCRLTGDCPMGATCSAGTCSCPAGEHACGQSCVSNVAVSSCGTRCSACAQPANSAATCTASACGFTCSQGYLENAGACVDVDECLTNNGGCSANAACTNTPGSRTCACNAGFTGDGVTCTDVNECLTNNGGCDINAACTNTPGARTCSCNTGFMGDGLTCADINECATNNGGCSTSATCANTPGGRTCTCIIGFTGTGLVCTDINECATNNGGCASQATCTNTPGSRTCACTTGFTGDGVTCTDVNECLTGNGGCDTNAACTNTSGSRTCACNTGFTGTGLSCTDINECATNNGGCAAQATCTNTPGSRTCACTTGYTGTGLTCTDVNECLTGNGGCDTNAVCTNTPGSRSCACNTGFTGTGLTCADVNECLTNNGGCAAVAAGGVCTNTPGSRTCACNTGYTGTGLTCADVDECATNNGGCAAVAAGGVCTNTPGSRTCACASGFTGTGLTCADVNECASNNGGCSVNATCTNTTGSRACACNPGFAGNGLTCSPNGDTCAAPIALTLSVATNGSSSGAINDYTGPLGPLCGGRSFAGPDVVYSFTPGATQNYRVTATGSGFSPVVHASPTCGVASACTAVGSGSGVNFHGTASTPVFLTLDSDTAQQAGPHAITVTPVVAPANDLCSSPTALSLATPVSGTFTGAVNDVGPAVACNSAFASSTQPDVVFSFTPSSSGNYIFRETTSSDVVMWVGTACDGSCLAFIDDPEQLIVPLTAGQTVFFVVEPYNTATTFTVSVEQIVTPPNDTCAGAIPLTVSVATSGNSLGGTNDYSSALSPICAGLPLVGLDVVYSFTPAATQNYRVTTTGSFTPTVYVSSACGVASSCSTLGNTGFNFHGTASTPVFLTVDADTTAEAGPHTISVAPISAPANDLCANPTVLSAGTPFTGTFTGAVNDLMPTAACSSTFALSTQPEVFFTFTPATTGTYVFRETTSSDVVMWASTACDGSCVGLVDEPEQLIVSLTGGQPYFLAVESYSTATTFTIVAEPVVAPPNDTCAGVIPLTVSVATNGNSLGGANDYSGPVSAVCAGQTYAGSDVVYSFTPATTQNYRVSVTAPNFSPTLYASSTCGLPSSCTALGGGSGVNFHGTASTPVFFTVDSDTTAQSGPHAITVAPITAPPNDVCSSPTALTLGVPISSTFSGAVNDVMPTVACNSSFALSTQPDVIFSFTPATTGTYAFSETTGSDVVMWVGTACNGTCVGFVDDPELLSLTLTAGQTYFFVVEPFSSATTFTIVVN